MKRDINLLPSKVKKISFATLVVIIILALSYITAALVFGLYFPLKEKEDYNIKIKKLQDSIASYNASETEYYSLQQTVNVKRREADALLALKENRLETVKLLNDIEKNIPFVLFLDQLTVSKGKMTLIGTTTDYKEIAKFIVKLRDVDKVIDPTFTTATLEKTQSQLNIGEDEENDVIEMYSFDIYSNMEYRDVINDLQGNGPQIEIYEGGAQ